MYRIPYGLWLAWSDQERAEILTWLDGKPYYLDLDDNRQPKNSRISDFEEHTGESLERGLNHRGFNFPYPPESNIGKKS